MKQYHKIQMVFLRDPKNKYRTLLEGQFALPEFEYLKDNIWVFTEKVDGTNIRIMWDGENVTFGGKTDNAQIPSFLVSRLNELFYKITKKTIFKKQFGVKNPDEKIEVCLYGEGYGVKIQKGGGNYKSDGQDFVLFDVRIGDWWLERHNVEDIANKFNVKVVPIVGEGKLLEAVERVREGCKSQWGEFRAEGLVMRPKVELIARNGKRIITKIKYRDFK